MYEAFPSPLFRGEAAVPIQQARFVNVICTKLVIHIYSEVTLRECLAENLALKKKVEELTAANAQLAEKKYSSATAICQEVMSRNAVG